MLSFRGLFRRRTVWTENGLIFAVGVVLGSGGGVSYDICRACGDVGAMVKPRSLVGFAFFASGSSRKRISTALFAPQFFRFKGNESYSRA